MNLNPVTFPRKRTTGTYSASVIGKPVIAKKTGKFVRLNYSELPARAEMLSWCESNGVDSAEALARGIDVILRARASGGMALASTLYNRLLSDGIFASISDTEKRGRRLRGVVQTILAMRRAMGKMSLEDCYKMVCSNL